MILKKELAIIFHESIKYMDSKRDRDTAIALFEKITSVKFVSKSLLGVGKQISSTTLSRKLHSKSQEL